MMRATEQLLTTGRRWLEMSDRLCQLPTQSGAFARFEQLTIDPVQQFSHQLGEILSVKPRVTPSAEVPPESSTQAIAPRPGSQLSRPNQPPLSNNFLPAPQPSLQTAASMPLPPREQRSHPTLPPPNPSRQVLPAPKVAFPGHGNHPDPQFLEKAGDLNPVDLNTVQLPSIQHISRVMAALSLTVPPSKTSVPNSKNELGGQISSLGSPSAFSPQLSALQSDQPTGNPSGQAVRTQPNEIHSDRKATGLQLAQTASALERVLQANVMEPGNREPGAGARGSKTEPGTVDASGSAPIPDQALLVEEILDELSDRLELDFIRTYGTAGGS